MKVSIIFASLILTAATSFADAQSADQITGPDKPARSGSSGASVRTQTSGVSSTSVPTSASGAGGQPDARGQKPVGAAADGVAGR